MRSSSRGDADNDATPAPMRFFSYKDPEGNTLAQMRKSWYIPWIAKDVPVRGL